MKKDEKGLLEANDNSTVLDLVDKERNILAKSKVLKLSNLTNKMTPTQNAIFSLALRNVEINGDSAITEIPISELIELLPDSSYIYFDKRIIARDTKAIFENHINLIDEKFFNNDPNGKLMAIAIFSYFRYERGKFVGLFNSTPDFDGHRLLLDILKSQEVNPLMYNLKTFSELSSSGQVLYEELLILSGQGVRSVKYSLEDLKQLFRVNGNSMNRFYTINQKHLKDAVADINEKTDMNLLVKQIKEGRAVVGVELVWSIDKVKLQATPSQRKTLDELFVQLKKLEPTEKSDLSLLRKLENSHLVSKQEAQGIISKAIERVSDLGNKIELKSSNSTENVVVADLDKVKEMFPRVTKKAQELLINAIQNFSEKEQEGILEYAMVIAKQNNARNVNYIVTLLNNWAIEEIQTKDQAVALHDQTYGETLPDMESIELSEDFMNAMDLWKES
jgi:DnaD domain protein